MELDQLQWMGLLAGVASLLAAGMSIACVRAVRRLQHSRQLTQRLLERVEREKELCRQVFNAMPVGLMVEDREGRITHFNNALSGLLGLEPNALSPLDLSLELLVSDVEKRQALIEFRHTLQERPVQLHQWEVPIKTLMGRLRWIRLSAQSLTSPVDGGFSGIVWLLEDITHARRDRQALETMSYQDMLTGLLNRRAFMENWKKERQRAQRYDFPLSLIVMDIDLFKQVNDRFGHAAGDAVLKWFARQCRRHLRRTDILARFGGEEFVALLPHTSEETAWKVAENLRRYFNDHVCPLQSGRVIRITFSGGVSQWHADETFDQLFHRADVALYEAKYRGRNQVLRWSEEVEQAWRQHKPQTG